MSARFWLRDLPSTDGAFGPLQRAAELDPEDFPALERAHKQAVADGTWGHSLEAMEVRAEALRVAAFRLRAIDKQQGGVNVLAVHTAELEALGYALGLTAVRVAIREHDEAQIGVAA